MTFNQRKAVVTGAGRGIGKAIAETLARHGVKVICVSKSESSCGAVAEAIVAAGGAARALAVDVADGAAVAKAAEQLLAEEGKIDLLINNAGITRDMTFKKMDKLNWDLVMQTNLDSVFNMTKPVCDGMVERGWGRIINISSVNGQKGAFGQTNYSAAKAGMHGFSKALAYEVARKGVTVNTISPGYIGTKMVTAIAPEVLETKILPQIPMGRLGKPEEVAGLVAYLASEEAAFLTGANIAINGGQHMQ
jgi:acetoacetyl-CoA reductase